MMSGNIPQLDEIYQEVILDHYKNPRCKGCLSNPTSSASLYNPLCGDEIGLTVTVVGDVITKIGFDGHGCSISQASASMMAKLCEGRTIADIATFQDLFRSLMRGELSEDKAEPLGDVVALEGVRRFSARVKCAVLAWEALERCLKGASPEQNG